MEAACEAQAGPRQISTDPSPHFCLPPLLVPRLLRLTQKNGYTPGVTLFGAGYDFRQSCRTSARALLARLQVQPGCGVRPSCGEVVVCFPHRPVSCIACLGKEEPLLPWASVKLQPALLHLSQLCANAACCNRPSLLNTRLAGAVPALRRAAA